AVPAAAARAPRAASSRPRGARSRGRRRAGPRSGRLRSRSRKAPDRAATRWLGKLLVDDPVVAKTDRLALDQEGQPRVVRPDACGLVVAEEPRFRLPIGRGVEPTADRRDVGQGLLEPLAGPSERRRLLLRALLVDAPVGLVGAGHRLRAIASRYTASVRSICKRTSNSRSATSRARRAMLRLRSGSSRSPIAASASAAGSLLVKMPVSPSRTTS